MSTKFKMGLIKKLISESCEKSPKLSNANMARILKNHGVIR